MKRFPLKLRGLAILLFSGVLFAGLFAFRYSDDFFDISRNLQIFADVYREVNLKYVDEVKPGELIKKGIDAMLDSLDPYTEYIPQSEVEEFKMKFVNPQYGGIGALIFQLNEKVIVRDVYEGFPAQKADIRAGDRILRFNDMEVNSHNGLQVSDMLKGQKGSVINLLISRPGIVKPIVKTLSREEIKLSNIPYYGILKNHTGYIKLNHFLENSSSEVKQAFLDLKDNQHITSLVFDLRGNGGGILQESVKIVNFFVEKGSNIVTQSGRNHQGEIIYKAVNQPLDSKIPIIILVDKGTASASEIVSGALQDLERAVIVGQRSFGKGLVQQTLPLSYNTLMKITVAKYYTPSGRCIQALDYVHRNKDGSVNQVADSTIVEFKTRAGRLVYDGSGIYPDLITKAKTFSNVLYALASRQLIFDYATLYKNSHLSISPAADFRLTDADYAAFTEFLATKNYDYITSTERLMDDLKQIAEREKRFDAIKSEYTSLKSKISHNKTEDLFKFKEEIKDFLGNEIVERYYFQKGKLVCSLSKDADIAASLKLFDNTSLFAGILQGTGAYHTIGKPEKPLVSSAQIRLKDTQDSLLIEEEK